MVTVKAYDRYDLGYVIDETGRWAPVELPAGTKMGAGTSGFGFATDASFLGFYVNDGALWVQLGTRRWPVASSKVTLERHSGKHVIAVWRSGMKMDELEYVPGWTDLPQEMMIEHADLGEEEFDLGCYIVARCAEPDVESWTVRGWSSPE